MRKRIALGLFVVFTGVLLVWSLSLSKPQPQKKEELFKQVELFSDTLAIIRTDYVDEFSPKDLIYGALKGMVSSLDPHSQFMDPDTYNELKVDTEGKFGGLGIEITIKDGLLTVVTPIDDTPAWKVGVKAGDRIVKINDELTRDLTLTDAVKKMRGLPGEAVRISVLRESENKILEFNIVRDIIKIKDIKDPGILVDGVGYVRLVEFRENTPEEFVLALDKLKKQGMDSFILDLRNNPGGLLDSAVRVTGAFLEKGKLIVSTKGRKATQNLEFFSDSASPYLDMPVVVLINEGSASGSEIVAGALQDYKRAIIVGTKSFGKGSVQTVLPLSDGSALRLTTSKYFTPLGKVIHGKGVIPDIEVAQAKVELPKAGDKDAVMNPNLEDVFDKIEDKKAESAEVKLPDYSADNQLSRAVDILKALKIYKSVGQNK